MSEISNDAELQEALSKLSIGQQRIVAAGFVENVLSLTEDIRLAHAVEVAADPEASETELNTAYRSAKSAAIDAHARCGADGEWTDQSGYFVARAMELVTGPIRTQGKSLAWKVALQCRMASACLEPDAGDNNTCTAQRQILTNYLNS